MKGVHDRAQDGRRLASVRIPARHLRYGHRHSRRQARHLSRPQAFLLATLPLRLGTRVADVQLLGIIAFAARNGGLGVSLMAKFAFH